MSEVALLSASSSAVVSQNASTITSMFRTALHLESSTSSLIVLYAIGSSCLKRRPRESAPQFAQQLSRGGTHHVDGMIAVVL